MTKPQKIEGGKKALQRLLKVIKEHSATLPIEIERHGIYAQGMHAGLDLAIDETIKLLKEYETN